MTANLASRWAAPFPTAELLFSLCLLVLEAANAQELMMAEGDKNVTTDL